MKLFYHPPADPQIWDVLHKREMRIENLLNKLRASFLSLIFLFDIFLILYKDLPYKHLISEVLILCFLLALFYGAHHLTSHSYHPWIKYMTVASDIAGTFLYSQLALKENLFPVDPAVLLVIMSIIFLFFNSLSVLRGGNRIIIFSAALTLIFNFLNYAILGVFEFVILYTSAFIVSFSIFNLFAGNAMIENLVNNYLLNSAMKEIQNANSEIESQNEMLVGQRDKIIQQKKEITDSIHYALRIQTAFLSPDYHIKKCLPESFIFYLPKDVVSGDFYYVDKVDEVVIFSAVDCTGHGVPGAMMSVIGFNLLNQAVKLKRMTNPSEILKFLDCGVTEMLRQISGESGVSDGMDLALCSWDLSTNVLQYAGAYNPLIYIRKNQLFKIEADKFPIGSNYEGVADSYITHTIQMEKGDLVYLYSDGYADQFGGPKNKKFKYQPLHNLLLSNHSLSMPHQMDKLKNAFVEWKMDYEQTDDIIVMGIKI